jgi:hypothetical protein
MFHFFLIKPTDALIPKIYFCQEIYMFRAVPLPIIRSFPLYIRHWYMSCRFDDSFQTRPGWNRGIARNMYSFLTKVIWEISASVGFVKNKFVTMHGHMNVKKMFHLFLSFSTV